MRRKVRWPHVARILTAVVLAHALEEQLATAEQLDEQAVDQAVLADDLAAESLR